MNKYFTRPYSTREHPEAAGMEALLHHTGGWPVLSITDSPQTLELEIINRTPEPVTAGPAHLQLIFRPGILTAIEDIALSPQSEAAWSLTIHPAYPQDPHSDMVFEFDGVDAFSLGPGESVVIRIDGLSADPVGGSRATRVQVQYGSFFLKSGVEVLGTQFLHLPVLRRHQTEGLPATELRSGSTAVSGPFLAGFLNGPDLLNDGKTPNTLKVRIINTTGRPMPLSVNNDEATRFYLTFRTGTENAKWGLLGSYEDHLDLAVLNQGWQVDRHTIRRVGPAFWDRDEVLDLELTVYTAAWTGDAQIILTYENLPTHDDGDLVLLAHLGLVATGDDDVRINGNLDVAGVISSGANYSTITPDQFHIAGSIDTFYPVVFVDDGWDRGEFRFEVFRAGTHVDGQWHGSMMAQVACHNDNFGNGSGYWSIVVRQSTASGKPTRHFVGAFESYPYAPKHVLWLAGDTTYSWIANHEASILDPAGLLHPGPVSVGTGQVLRTYALKSAPDPRYLAEYISISESLGSDTGPVPRGGILMWSGSMTSIPLGWALCDGSNGTPDLRGRFIVGAGSGTYDNGETFNFPAPQLGFDKTPIANQTGGRSKVPLSAAEMPPHTHTGKTNSDGAHSHHVPVYVDGGTDHPEYPPANGYLFRDLSQTFQQTPKLAPTTSTYQSEHQHQLNIDSAGAGAAHENLPPYFVLCFIIKL